MTIIKNPITHKPEIEEKEKKQGKRRKSETLCVDKRRDLSHCGICGSPDLVFEQLVYCEECGKESFNIGVQTSWRINSEEYPCDCKGPKMFFRNKVYHRDPHRSITIRICVACKSTEAHTCPACDKANYGKSILKRGWNLGCWTSITGEKFCRSCGYRSPGFGK